jgi:hypothetical protein
MESEGGRIVKKILRITLLGLFLTAALVYVGDWAVWRIRVARGGGIGTVTVTRFVVAPLKGNKEEDYPDGTEDTGCSRSLFPQGGVEPCWWLERHSYVFER